MLCNSRGKIQFILFVISALSSCNAQNPTSGPNPRFTEILRKPEAYQRAFAADFLQGQSCNVEGYPPSTSDHCHDFRFLVNAKDWVLPMTEVRIREWLNDPQANRESIDHVMTTLATVRCNIEVLEFIARVFSDSSDLRKWLGTAIRESYGVPDPNFITYYYNALESKNSVIREVAEQQIPIMLNAPNMATLNRWGEGLIIRYGHEPSSLELLTDPILKIARVGNAMHPEDLHRSLADYAKKAYEQKPKARQQQP